MDWDAEVLGSCPASAFGRSLHLPARFPPFIWVGDGSTTMASLPCEGSCLDGRFVPPRLCQNISLAALAPRGPAAGDTEDQDHQGGQAAAGVPEALLPRRVRHPQRLSGQTDLRTVSTLGPCCLQVLPSLALNQTLSCHRPRPRVRAVRHSIWLPWGQQGVAPGTSPGKALGVIRGTLHGKAGTAWRTVSSCLGLGDR